MIKKILLAVFVIAVIVGGVVLNEKYPRMYQNYEYTVVIETPDGIKTGSTVRKVGLAHGPSFSPEDSSLKHHFRGEAVIVDLGEKGKLFGLISSYSYQEVTKAFSHIKPLSNPEVIRYYGDLEVGKKKVLTDGYSRFVRFDDLNDPLSVKAVDIKDLSETYGEGFKLKEITIEIIDKNVTRYILNVLPWLRNLEANIDGSKGTFSNNLSNALHVGNFTRGNK